MPLTSIDILHGRSPSEKETLLRAVHEAMLEALKIPDEDRKYRLREYPREEFWVPPSRSDRYTVVEISLFPGRSLEAKRRLYQAIVRNLGALGTPADEVFIVLHEPPMENWGVRGGVPASEVDPGFEVRI